MSSLFGISANGADASFYNDVATQSLRLDSGSSAYLSRTPSSAGNRKTWTWSGWLKRGNLGGSHGLIESTSISLGLHLDKLFITVAGVGNGLSTAVFRDSSAWYHVLIAFDTTQASSADRVKFYVNGTQHSLDNTRVSQNTDYNINNTTLQRIGVTPVSGSTTYIDGYLSEVNFVDGTALDPTSFGETKNGVWIPIEYTGSYGTNGYRLQFDQTGTGTASASTIGADTSGNNNHYTSSGIVASDCNMPDSPENNFCTLNPLFATGVTNTFSEGNLKVATSSSGRTSIPSTFVMPTGTGKWFFEARVSGNGGGVGIMRTDAPYNNDYYYGDYQWSVYDHSVIHNGASVGSLTGSATYPEVYGLMLDTDTDTLKVYVGGSEVGSFSVDAGYDYYAISGDGSGAVSITSQFNFGQDSTFQGDETAGGNVDANGIGDFSMTVPTDAKALCSTNLPEPTISPNADTQADDYFNTVIYTGTGNNTQDITGVGFQPDWVWIKNRSSGYSHQLQDSNRGMVATKILSTNQTAGEGVASATGDNYGHISAVGADGFTVTHTINANNDGGTIRKGTHFLNDTYVAWNWKSNGGTTSTIAVDSVSSGVPSIASTVQANTDAGFSIVTYTGNVTAGATVGHGLGAIPKMIIVKSRDNATPWVVYHSGNTSAPETEYLRLNETSATADFTTWNDTAPTSSVFSLGTTTWVNATSSMLAYCFAEIEGYSKFGSYTGNGSTDGTFVYLGFRPAFVMVKRTDSADHWNMLDVKRDTFNVMDTRLLANNPTSEQTSSSYYVDFTSNGFKLRTSDGGWNGSGATYIYMSFAQNPFKYSLGR